MGSPCGEQVPAGVWRAALNTSGGQGLEGLLHALVNHCEGWGCSTQQIAAGTDTLCAGMPPSGISAFSRTVSSAGMFSLAVAPVQVLQSLYDSVLEWGKTPNNKAKLEPVTIWFQFSLSQVGKTIPASGIYKLSSCLDNISSCSLIKYVVLLELSSSEHFAFHSAWYQPPFKNWLARIVVLCTCCLWKLQAGEVSYDSLWWTLFIFRECTKFCSSKHIQQQTVSGSFFALNLFSAWNLLPKAV